MMSSYSGRLADLSDEEQTAIHRLTVRRYRAETLRLCNRVRRSRDVTCSGLGIETALESLDYALCTICPRTQVSALFTWRDGRAECLAALRTQHSSREMLLTDTIGDPTCPLPTHRYFTSLSYGDLHREASTVSESSAYEVCRLVAADARQLSQLTDAGVLTTSEATFVRANALDHLIVSTYRRERAKSRLAVITVLPRVALALARRGLTVIPLATVATRATTAAPSVMLAPPTERWTMTRDMKRALVSAETRTDKRVQGLNWHDWSIRGLRVPFSIWFDAESDQAIERLQDRTAEAMELCGLSWLLSSFESAA